MKKVFKIISALILFAVLAWFSMVFQVREGRVAIVTRFGKPWRVVTEPQAYFKLPWPIERVNYLDARRRVYETSYAEMLTRRQINLVVHTYVVWRIGDPLKFLESFSSPDEADSRLDGLIVNITSGIIGNYEFTSLVSNDPSEIRLDDVEREVFEAVVKEVGAHFGGGVIIEQVGFKRISLPQANIERVFDYMREERATVAMTFIADGNRMYTEILSQAEQDSQLIYSTAIQKAAEIEGESKAEVAQLYAGAQSQNPEFYEFSKTIESLKKILYPNAVLILSVETPPFDVIVNDPDAAFEEMPEVEDILEIVPEPQPEAENENE